MFKLISICLLINLTLVALGLANQFLETSISNGYNNKEREIGNHINITEPTEMKAIQGRDMSIWSYMNFLESMIMKYKNEALSYLDNLLNVPNNVLPTINGLPTFVCNDEKKKEAKNLSNSLENWIIGMIMYYKNVLSNLNITETQSITGMLSNQIKISEFTLKDIVTTGLENIDLSTFDLDMCKNSSEIEIKLPNLVISGLYTLNGVIDGHPITGNGSIRMDIDSLRVYFRTNIICHLLLSSKLQCRLTKIDNASTIQAKSFKVNITGISYRDLDENVINAEINRNIAEMISNRKSRNSNTITNFLTYKDKLLKLLPPNIINFIKSILNMFKLNSK